jgi:predicted MFS family arabinose efflux permease
MTALTPTAPARVSARAWSVLGILALVYVLNFLDRQLLSILAKPIQDSLHVSDSQLGRIGGLYFAIFYCFISIPVGWLADRTNRVRVLSIACALWSAATMACGLSANYGQLVISRMAVGIGEAGGVPPSYAIVSDTFPPGRRGAALGLYNLGPPIGQALGVAFGASIAAAFSWRHAFVALGAVGIAAALIVVIFVREPKRGGLDVAAGGEAYAAPVKRAGLFATIAMFFSRPTLMLMALASGATQFVTYGLVNFTTLFLMREKGMTLSDVALWYALVIGIGMSAGIALSGRIIDRFTRKSKVAFALVPGIALIIAVPFFLAFLRAPTWQLATAFLIGPTFFNYFYLSSAVTFVQEEVAPHQRVMSGALLLLIMNLIGLGLGPTWVGAASDWFKAHGSTHSLQSAFYTLLPFYAVAVVLFFWLAIILRKKRSQVGVTA